MYNMPNNNNNNKRHKTNTEEEELTLQELFDGLGGVAEPSTPNLFLLHCVRSYLSYRDINCLRLVSRPLNAVFQQHLFKTFGGCRLDGNILRFDRDRERFHSSHLVAGGTIGKHLLCGGRSEVKVTIPSNASPGFVRIGITRERPDDKFNHECRLSLDDICIPKKWRSTKYTKNTILTLYHAVQIKNNSIEVTSYKRIGEENIFIKNEEMDRSVQIARQDDITFTLQYTTDQMTNNDIPRAKFQTSINDISPYLEVKKSFNGGYVWFVEMGPIPPFWPDAFVTINGIL